MPANRLVAFGCSHTYGDALPDCYIIDPDDHFGYRAGPTPSVHAWPNLAAEILNIQCLNLGRSGNSNTGMLMAILAHAWQPGDVAAVLWTYPDRETLFLDDGPRHIGPWNAATRDFAIGYYMAHDPSDLQMRAWIAHHHAASYLRSISIPFVMSSADHWMRNRWVGTDHRDIDSSTFAMPFIDTGLDGWHGGVKQHAAWANVFAERIRTVTNG